MRVDYSPFEGKEIVGGPTHVLQRGRVIVKDGQFLGKPGQGQFLRRGTFNL